MGIPNCKSDRISRLPGLKQNLLSISQYIADHNCDFCFNSEGFTITDRQSGRLILAGIKIRSLYVVEEAKHCGFVFDKRKKNQNPIVMQRI